MTSQVQLTEEEANALQAAMQKEQKAQVAAEIAMLRKEWMDAAEAKSTMISTLAKKYGFTPEQQLQYDPQSRMLTERNGNGSNIR